MSKPKSQTHWESSSKDPRAEFGTPEAVLDRSDLTASQKTEILRRWEYDERAIAVAVEEGMSDEEPKLLSRILIALGELPVPQVEAPRSPTKQGGG